MTLRTAKLFTECWKLFDFSSFGHENHEIDIWKNLFISFHFLFKASMESVFFCAEDFFGLTKVDSKKDWHKENIHNWAPKAVKRRSHSNYS